MRSVPLSLLLLRAVLLMALAAGNACANAPPPLLDDGLQGMMLGRSMQYLVDTGGKLTIDDIETHRDGASPPAWQPLPDDIANFGLSPAVYWFRLPLRVPDAAPAWLMEISYSLLDHVDFHVRAGAGSAVDPRQMRLMQQRAGLAWPQHERVMPHRFILFPLPPLGAGDYTIYLRVQSFHAVQVPVALWHVDDYLWRDEAGNVIVGIFAGAMLVMLVYNLLLYSVVRERIYLINSGVVVGVMLLQFGMQGVGLRHFWPDALWFAVHSVPLAGLLSTFFCAYFTVDFLHMKERRHPLTKPYLFVGYTALLSAALSLVIPATYSVLLTVLCALAGDICASMMLVSIYANRNRPIVIFGLGWTVLICGVLLLALNKLGVVPMNFFTEQLFALGILIQLVLFSMALGDRINFEKQQTLAAQQVTLSTLELERQAITKALHNEEQTRLAREKTLSLQTQNNLTLETEIAERTHELAAATEQLREISRRDALTGIYNRREFNERLHTEYARAARSKGELCLVLLDVDHFKVINDNYGHLAGDDCLSFVARLLMEQVGNELASAFRYGGEEFALLLPGQPAAAGQALAERIRRKLAERAVLSQGRTLRLTLSAGVADMVADTAHTAKDLIEQADHALYQAKTDGRNCVRVAAASADAGTRGFAHD